MLKDLEKVMALANHCVYLDLFWKLALQISNGLITPVGWNSLLLSLDFLPVSITSMDFSLSNVISNNG